jgi:hypothetical protein
MHHPIHTFARFVHSSRNAAAKRSSEVLSAVCLADAAFKLQQALLSKRHAWRRHTHTHTHAHTYTHTHNIHTRAHACRWALN